MWYLALRSPRQSQSRIFQHAPQCPLWNNLHEPQSVRKREVEQLDLDLCFSGTCNGLCRVDFPHSNISPSVGNTHIMTMQWPMVSLGDDITSHPSTGSASKDGSTGKGSFSDRLGLSCRGL